MSATAERVVGRDEELAAIAAFLADAELGGTAAVIEGEAGIGKTTLWQYGVNAAQELGHRVLVARPAGAEARLSFAALGDLLEGAVEDVLEDVAAPQRRALEVALLLAEAAGPPPDRRAVSVASLAALRALAAREALVVAIDDVQWLDPPSEAVLAFAVRRLRSEPVRFLLARRLEAPRDGTFALERALTEARLRRIPVGPLSLGALHHLLRTRLGTPFPRPLLRRIHELSAGNPFFALELARAFRRGAVRIEPGEQLPVSLEALVRERLAALPGPTQEALAIAASASQPTLSLLELVRDREALGVLSPAVDALVVEVEDGRVRFTHPLLASGAYLALDAAGRRDLHERLARVVADVEERARHLALAVSGPDAGVAATLEEGARHALARGAPAAAADLSERAARLTPAERAADARRRLVDAAFFHFESGDSRRARALLEDVIAAPGAGPERARALIRLARVRGYDDDLRAAAELFLQAVAEAGDDRLVRAEAHEGASTTFFKLRERLREAADHAEAAAELAAAVGATSLLGEALSSKLMVEAILGRERAEATLAAALEVQPAVEHVRILAQPVFAAAIVSMWSDDHARARTTLETLHRRASELGDESSLPYLLAILAQAECLLGDYSAARSHADEGFELAEQAGQESLRAYHLALRALVGAHTGDLEAARDAALASLAVASRTNARPAEHFATTALGLLELSAGRPGEAARVLRPLAALVRREAIDEPGVVTRFAADHVEALVELGDLDAASETLDWYEGNAARLPRHSALANAARCRGLLAGARGDVKDAVTAFERALGEHDLATIRFDRARTLLALGATYRRSKQKRAARAAPRRSAGRLRRPRRRRLGREREGGAGPNRRSCAQPRRADGGGETRGRARRRRTDESRGRGRTFHRRSNRGGPSLPDLREGRRSLARGARAALPGRRSRPARFVGAGDRKDRGFPPFRVARPLVASAGSDPEKGESHAQDVVRARRCPCARPCRARGRLRRKRRAGGGCRARRLGNGRRQAGRRLDRRRGGADRRRVGEGAVWVASFDGDTVTRLDPKSKAPSGQPIRVGNGPFSIAVGEGSVWVANQFDDTVVRIDPRSNQMVGKPIPVGDRPLAVAVGEGSVWAFSSLDSTLTRIDPKTGKVVSTSPPILTRQAGTPDYAGLAVADGSLWVTSPGEGTIVRVDARSNRRVGKPIEVGAGPLGLAVVDGTVWVANYDGASVSRVDARTGKPLGEPIAVDGQPIALAAGEDGSVWVAIGTGSVVRIDPKGNGVGEPIPVSQRAQAVAVADGEVWVANQLDNTVARIAP